MFSSRLIPLIPQAVCRSLVLSQYFGMPVQAIFQKDADPGKKIKGKQKLRDRIVQTANEQIKVKTKTYCTTAE